MKFEQIKEKIKNGVQYFLFNMKPDKPYLLVKGKTKTELKKKLKEKVIKTPDKYRNSVCILMYFKFQIPNNRFTVGDLLVIVHRYKITENLGLIGDDRFLGHVYFKKSWLEDNGWSYTYLQNIIFLYKLRKINFNEVGQPGYNELKWRIDTVKRYYETNKKLNKKVSK